MREQLTLKPITPYQALQLWNLLGSDIDERKPPTEIALIVLQGWPFFPTLYEDLPSAKDNILFAAAFLEQWAEELKLLGLSIVEEPPKKRKKKGDDDDD